jgi:hypothetical protein
LGRSSAGRHLPRQLRQVCVTVSARLPLRFAPDISVRVETETVDGRKIARTICVVSARHAARPPSA